MSTFSSPSKHPGSNLSSPDKRGAGGDVPQGTNVEWIARVQAEIAAQSRREKLLREIEEAQLVRREGPEEFFEETQLEVLQLEQELDSITDRNVGLAQKLMRKKEEKEALKRETTALREKLNSFEYLIEKHAAQLVRAGGGVGTSVRLTKAEVRAIFVKFCEPDGTGNCLRASHVLRVWNDIWRAQGRMNEMPPKAQQLVLRDLDLDLEVGLEDWEREKQYVQWKEFWDSYRQNWADVAAEGVNL